MILIWSSIEIEYLIKSDKGTTFKTLIAGCIDILLKTNCFDKYQNRTHLVALFGYAPKFVVHYKLLFIVKLK